jgi:hypothetical protein
MEYRSVGVMRHLRIAPRDRGVVDAEGAIGLSQGRKLSAGAIELKYRRNLGADVKAFPFFGMWIVLPIDKACLKT